MNKYNKNNKLRTIHISFLYLLYNNINDDFFYLSVLKLISVLGGILKTYIEFVYLVTWYYLLGLKLY